MRNVEAAALEGRIVQIAFLRGSKIEVALDPIMRKRLTFTGSTLRPRSVEQKGAIAAELREKVWPLLASGRVRPLIHATFPLAQAADAHRLMGAMHRCEGLERCETDERLEIARHVSPVCPRYLSSTVAYDLSH